MQGKYGLPIAPHRSQRSRFMEFPLLIMNVQVFSVNMDARYLTSKEAVLRYEHDTIIKIPLVAAQTVNGGPVVGEHYFIRYRDGIGEDIYPPEFCYIGMKDKQLIFASAN
jgi:hypothetical protein